MRAKLLLLAFALLLAPSFAFAQFKDSGDFGGLGGLGDLDLGSLSDPVFFSAEFMPATDKRPAVVAITAEVEAGYHIYSLTQPKGGPQATRIELADSDQYWRIGPWKSNPEPKSRIDTEAFKGVTIEEHHGTVVFYAPIQFAEGVDPSTIKVSGVLKGQACKEACVPLKHEFDATLGEGIEIGEVEVDEAMVAEPPRQTLPQRSQTYTAQTTPPASAGVYRADGSAITWYGWVAAIGPDQLGLHLQAQPTGNWHVNAYEPTNSKGGVRPTLIGLEAQPGITFQQPNVAGDIVERDGSSIGFGTIRYHDGTATWAIPINIDKSSGGNRLIRGVLGYQACEADASGFGSCELSKGVAFTADLSQVAGGSALPLSFSASSYNFAAELATGTSFSEATQPATRGGDNDELAPIAPSGGSWNIVEFNSDSSGASSSFLIQIGFAMLGGLILNLMPCVLPVIGLKVLAFAKQGGESRTRVFALNLAYVAGLMAVFMLLATLAALPQLGIGSEDYGWGELNTKTWFKVSMAGLVFAMALSFLGIWEIPIPGFAGTGAAAELSSREGFAGAFSKGVFTTILATPCSGPFLGPVLGYTISQPPQITYAIFAAIGLGMALPYLVIAVVPSLVNWIPKPGAWMDTFKQLMAFLLLGTVVYLFSAIGDKYHVATLALLIGIWFTCWWIGRTPLTASSFDRAMSWFGGTATAAAVGFLAFTYLVPGNDELEWKPYTPVAVTQAQSRGQTVLVDFTADWCPTCKWNMEFVIDTPPIAAIATRNDLLVLKADWTDENDQIEATLEQLKSRSIPLLAIYPGGEPGKVILLRDTISQTQLMRALDLAGASKSNPEAGWIAAGPNRPSTEVSMSDTSRR